MSCSYSYDNQSDSLSVSTECADSVLPAYISIIERREDTPFNQKLKAWQQLQRGRFLEFNPACNSVSGFSLL